MKLIIKSFIILLFSSVLATGKYQNNESFVQTNTELRKIQSFIEKNSEKTVSSDRKNLNLAFSQTERISKTKKNFKEPKTIQGLNWPIQGYNLLFGNPMPTNQATDPGFSMNIFQLSEDTKVPDGFQYNPGKACNFKTTGKVSTTVTELRDSFSFGVKVSAGYGPVSFSANTEYSNMLESVSKNERVISTVFVQCEEYELNLVEESPPKFDSNYIDRIKALVGKNFSSDKSLFLRFFKDYGTHICSNIVMGSRYTKIQSMTKKFYEKNKSDKVKVGLEANVDGGKFKGGVETNTSVENSNKSTQNNEESETTISTIGARLAKTEDEWLQKTAESPLPIKISLSLHSEFLKRQKDNRLTELGLTNESRNVLAKELDTAMEGYCQALFESKEVKTCNPEQAGVNFDPSAIELQEINFTLLGDEGTSFTLDDKRLVRYAVSTQDMGFYKIVKGNFLCGNNEMGDPWSGKKKFCYTTEFNLTDRTWKKCADNGQVCSVPKNKQLIVAYGSNDKFIVTQMRNDFECNNQNLKSNVESIFSWGGDRTNATLNFPNKPSSGNACWVKLFSGGKRKLKIKKNK